MPHSSSIPAFVLCLTVLLPRVEADEPVWSAHSIDPRTEDASGADGVRLMDVNSDGWLDVASGWEQARQTRVYLHPGADKVREPWPKVIVGKDFGAPEDAVFADLDGDGAVDVVTSSEGSRLHVHWAPKEADDYLRESAWETAPLPAGQGHAGMFVVPLQLDGKNGVDLVSGGKEKDLIWLESPANPRDLAGWKRHVISSRCRDGWTMGVYPADFDGDGDQDILWTARKGANGGVRWMENPGPGPAQTQPWTEHAISQTPENYMFGDVADVDGDGRLDVVAPVHSGALHFFRNLGENRWRDVAIPSADTKKGAAVGDVNLDGHMDIVVNLLQTNEGPVWYRFTGDPMDPAAWTRNPTGTPGGKSDLVRLYDVDRDGDLDILTTIETKSLQVTWYENPYAGQAKKVVTEAP